MKLIYPQIEQFMRPCLSSRVSSLKPIRNMTQFDKKPLLIHKVYTQSIALLSVGMTSYDLTQKYAIIQRKRTKVISCPHSRKEITK